MTRIGIVGAGNGAALHADTVLRLPETELVGLGVRRPSRSELPGQAGVPALPIDELCSLSELLIVAVPPAALASVLDTVNRAVETGAPVRAMLVEPPLGPRVDLPLPTMAGANLFHAPVVQSALKAIAQMDRPHHLRLTARQARPQWTRGDETGQASPLVDPGVRLASLLLAAAGEPATSIDTTADGDRTVVELTLASGRLATLSVEWSNQSAVTTLEAADASRVVHLTLDPLPSLELNGVPAASPELSPLEALGFVAQTRRLIRVGAGSVPWPPVDATQAVEDLLGTSKN